MALRKKMKFCYNYIGVPRTLAIILLIDVLIINSGYMLILPKMKFINPIPSWNLEEKLFDSSVNQK
jgi:hypothetical protein